MRQVSPIAFFDDNELQHVTYDLLKFVSLCLHLQVDVAVTEIKIKVDVFILDGTIEALRHLLHELVQVEWLVVVRRLLTLIDQQRVDAV